jgi:two-component system, LytTR family, response regulator
MTQSRKLSITDKVLLYDGEKCKLVSLCDVRFFETFGNYSKTYFNNGMLIINRTLNHLESKLPGDYFFRANRQYIINLTHVSNVVPESHSVFRIIMNCGKEVDISRRRSQLFRDALIL